MIILFAIFWNFVFGLGSTILLLFFTSLCLSGKANLERCCHIWEAPTITTLHLLNGIQKKTIKLIAFCWYCHGLSLWELFALIVPLTTLGNPTRRSSYLDLFNVQLQKPNPVFYSIPGFPKYGNSCLYIFFLILQTFTRFILVLIDLNFHHSDNHDSLVLSPCGVSHDKKNGFGHVVHKVGKRA